MIDSGLAHRLAILARQRETLLIQSAATRQRAISIFNELAPITARIDLVIGFVRYLKQHPLFTTAAIAVAVRFWPRRGNVFSAASIVWSVVNRLFR